MSGHDQVMTDADAALATSDAPGGRILLRIPKSLHAELSAAAEREGVSLNQFCAAALAGAVGWRA